MSKATIDIKISGLEPMKKLVGLLADNYARLPPAIQEAIGELYAEERKCWDADYFNAMGINSYDVKVVVDGVETSKIIAIYPDDAEIMVLGEGIRKFSSLQVLNASTREPVCGVGNGDKE